MEPMSVNSIPIYYGADRVSEDFNTKSFINCHDFKNFDDVIQYILHIDNNDNEYLSILREPWFPDSKIPNNNCVENIKSFLYMIFK